MREVVKIIMEAQQKRIICCIFRPIQLFLLDLKEEEKLSPVIYRR